MALDQPQVASTPYSELSDLDLMKLCVWREARGEGILGKRGVAHVIRNRVDNPSWWGSDVHSVILKPWQFSSFNAGDPNADKWPLDDDSSFIDCASVCETVMNGTDSDVTSGATFYHDVTIPEPQEWIAANYKLTLQVGRLRFYKV